VRLQLTSLWADRYAEYGLAKVTQGVSLASMQNAAGFYVQPSEVVNNYNITAVFGDDFAVPSSLVSRAWANVSLFQSSKLASAWSHANLPPLYVYACEFFCVPKKAQHCPAWAYSMDLLQQVCICWHSTGILSRVHACSSLNSAESLLRASCNLRVLMCAEQPKVFPISGLEYLNMDQNLTSKGDLPAP